MDHRPTAASDPALFVGRKELFEIGRMKRFSQKPNCASREAILGRARCLEARHHEDPRLRPSRKNAGDEWRATLIWHVQIEEDGGRRLSAMPVEQCISGRENACLVPEGTHQTT